MIEPTYKQHKILENLVDGPVFLDSDDPKIKIYWELVRAGYIDRFACFKKDWKFVISDKGLQYLENMEI